MSGFIIFLQLMIMQRYSLLELYLQNIIFLLLGILFFDHMTNIEKFIFSSTALCVCAYTKVFISFASFDILLVPIFLLAAITIINMFSHLGTVFAYIGKYSTNIWLTHSFYCYYFGPFAKLVYKSKNFIIDYLVLLALSLVTSILLNLFLEYVKICYQHIHTLLLPRTAN